MSALSVARAVRPEDEEAAAPVREENGTGRTAWSTELPGFGLRTYASGRQTYVVHTIMQGRLRLVTLGSPAVLTATEAKRHAWQVLARAHGGGNPAEDRKAARTAPEFQAFLEAYWKRAEPRWKPSTIRTHRIYRRLHMEGLFEGKGVEEITHPEVLAWFREMSDRVGPGAANRCMAILHAAFMRAEAWGYRPDGTNPCRGVRLNRQRKMERFLSTEELCRLGATLARQPGRDRVKVAAVTLLALTGCRIGEVLALKWSDVRGLRLQLRDSKTGPRTVWIGEEGRAVLDGLDRRRGVELVFYDPERGQAVTLYHFWGRLRVEADLPKVRLHDLRHTFASRAAAMSETMPVIGKLLGHKHPHTTQRYTHFDDADVLAVSERIGVAIGAMMSRG